MNGRRRERDVSPPQPRRQYGERDQRLGLPRTC